MKNIANILTSGRIIVSIIILFFSPSSDIFWALYMFCGLSDMVDGTIARRTCSDSKFGAKLDSVADLIFVLVCMKQIIPLISLNKWIWTWVMVIALIKVMNLISGFIYHKRVTVLHTTLNKATGVMLFAFPLAIFIVDVNLTGVLAVSICIIASFAAVQEGYLIITKE